VSQSVFGISSDITGKMLLQWGVILTTLDALTGCFKANRAQMRSEGVWVVPSRPQTEARYPAVIARPSSIRFEAEGVNGWVDDPGGMQGMLLYRSHGSIRLEVIGLSEEEAWSISDFLTHQYLGGLVEAASWYRTVAQEVERIAVAYQPGVIEWGDIQERPRPWAEDSEDKLYAITSQIPFYGEHQYFFDWTNVSGITIETVPKAPGEGDGWKYVNTKV
jgi:hypothetical protein